MNKCTQRRNFQGEKNSPICAQVEKKPSKKMCENHATFHWTYNFNFLSPLLLFAVSQQENRSIDRPTDRIIIIIIPSNEIGHSNLRTSKMTFSSSNKKRMNFQSDLAQNNCPVKGMKNAFFRKAVFGSLDDDQTESSHTYVHTH